MTAKLISGTEIAKQIREEIKQEVLQIKAKYNLVPGLATIYLAATTVLSPTSAAKKKLPRNSVLFNAHRLAGIYLPKRPAGHSR